MNVSPRVLEICDQLNITMPELLEMVKRAAITSQEGGNRRFHGWLFDVKEFEVIGMRRSEMPVHGEDSGAGVRAYDCPMCSGWGCMECGWWGKAGRYV